MKCMKVVGVCKNNKDPRMNLEFMFRIPKDAKLTKKLKSQLIVESTGITNIESKYDWTFQELSEEEFTQIQQSISTGGNRGRN